MIASIHLQNFRSYKNESFDFENGVNIIVGPNASGKTNLLEAILVSCRGKSYRSSDYELVRLGAEWARIDTHTQQQQRTIKIKKDAPGALKTIELGGKTLSRLTSPKQRLPSVLFEPNHLMLLSGGPQRRREFADELIEQTTAGYGTVVRHYKKALAQRNRLLKSHPQAVQDQMFAWDVRLSELGSQIVSERLKIIETINRQLPDTYSGLAGKKTNISVAYSNAIEPAQYASYMLKKLQSSRELDFARGFSGVGPHREDLLFSINDQPLAQAASRGEARTALLAIKIIELSIIENLYQQKPLLLLDDVFSELDGARRKALTEFMKNYQTFITTTDADVVAKAWSQKANLVSV